MKLVKRKKHIEKSYTSLDTLIEIIQNPSVFQKDKQSPSLPIIKEEPVIIKDITNKIDTSILNNFIYCTSRGNNWLVKKWFFMKNTEINVLSYKSISDTWYLNNDKIKLIELQNVIDENLVYLQIQLDNSIILKTIVSNISLSCGEPYITFNEIGWVLQQGSIRNNDRIIFLKITIDTFNVNNITVLFENTIQYMDHKQLLQFMNNQDFTLLVKQIKDYNSMKFIELQQNIKIQKEQNNIANKLQMLKLTDKLKLSEKHRRPGSLYIKSTLKEMYETISCKKFPEKNYWE